jgi:hypothetical protein
MNLKTIVISPKAVLAFAYPLIATIAATVASWIVSGDFNTAEIQLSVAGLITSASAALGAAVGKPGRVQEVPANR